MYYVLKLRGHMPKGLCLAQERKTMNVTIIKRNQKHEDRSL